MGLSIDRDEVISGLEKCAASECNEKCPYNGINYGCRPRLMLDAVELLKEQEAAEPLFNERTKWFVCPNCSLVLDEMRDDYCPSCGKRIAWNDYYLHEDEAESR